MASGRACGCTQRVCIALDESVPQQNLRREFQELFFDDLLFLPTRNCWAVGERGAAPPAPPAVKGAPSVLDVR